MRSLHPRLLATTAFILGAVSPALSQETPSQDAPSGSAEVPEEQQFAGGQESDPAGNFDRILDSAAQSMGQSPTSDGLRSLALSRESYMSSPCDARMPLFFT